MNPGKFVVFTLDGERYGLPIESVQQILRAAPITRLPNSNPEILGVFDLRGETLHVIDTRSILGLPPGNHACFVVVVSNEYRFALTVDRVDQIEDFAEGQIEATGEPGMERRPTYVGKRPGKLTILLSPDAVIPEEHDTAMAA